MIKSLDSICKLDKKDIVGNNQEYKITVQKLRIGTTVSVPLEQVDTFDKQYDDLKKASEIYINDYKENKTKYRKEGIFQGAIIGASGVLGGELMLHLKKDISKKSKIIRGTIGFLAGSLIASYPLQKLMTRQPEKDFMKQVDFFYNYAEQFAK